MKQTNRQFDFAVIGAGIAGTSIASELAQYSSVLLLEMESHPGYHSTGRSAALFAPAYGPPPIRALTRASSDFFHYPPESFCEKKILSPRGFLMISNAAQLPELTSYYREISQDSNAEWLDTVQLLQQHPLIKKEYACAGVLETDSSDIDVSTLHQGFLNSLKTRKGQLQLNAKVHQLSHINGTWHIKTSNGDFQSNVVVNASGAWADEIGTLAEAEVIGLVPKRRTAIIIEAPDNQTIQTLPLIADVDESFYMKPDAGRLLISPANEDPVTPCDVQPEEMDIALCIDRIENTFNIDTRKIISKWAGLRSFVSDKCPVVGYSNRAENFFWLAGQGGYGIQSSPALSRYASALALGKDLPDDVLAEGLNPSSISIDRFTASTESQRDISSATAVQTPE